MKQKNNWDVEQVDEIRVIKSDLWKSMILSLMALGIIVGVFVYLNPTVITLLFRRG